MKKLLCLVFALSFIISGCTRTAPPINVDNQYVEGEISYQTSSYVFTLDTLISDYFYVKHDGYYYPLLLPTCNYGTANPAEYVDSTRFMYWSIEGEKDIPTLFLGNGDELIYYSKQALLDYLIWERYYDLGYSLGVKDLYTMTSGRCYVDLTEDVQSIFESSELYSLYTVGVPYMLFDRVGGVQLTANHLKYGIIQGLEKGKQYNLDVYVGTNYQQCIASANMHYFNAMELFASVDYKTPQATIYTIEIPDYFEDGYYSVNNHGVVRIVHDDFYTEDTNFNTPILICDSTSPGRYSEYAPLNYYATTFPDTIGYVEKSETSSALNDLIANFLEIKTRTWELFLPEGELCRIELVSNETAGDAILTMQGEDYALLQEGDILSYAFTGNGGYATFSASGFYNAYDLSFTGCYESEIPEDYEEPVQEGGRR